MPEFISMSQKELDRYDIIKRLIRGTINGTDAADYLKLSVRQIKRLKAKVLKAGAKGLIHGNRGKESNRQIPKKEKQMIIKILHKHYYDFKPGFAAEKLRENHNVKRDPKTIRQIMMDEKLWKPRRKKKKSEHRKWRERKAVFGEMEQFDGSYERWFEDRADECCLLAAIDDATGRVTKAKFVKDEGVFCVFGFWKEYMEKNGKPRVIYTDKFSTYKMNQQTAINNPDTQTQFQRAMESLQVTPIFANSAEAKGRVERLFKTLQDRLIKEMRLAKISDREKANKFLEETFLPKFNERFSVQARKKGDLHRTLSNKETRQLESVFSRQTKRIVQNDFTVGFGNRWYQLTKEQPVTVCKQDNVMVEERLDGDIKIRLRGRYLNYELLPEHAKKRLGKKDIQWVIAATAQSIEKAKITVH